MYGLPHRRCTAQAASLASRLIGIRRDFSIVENFLSTEHSSTQARADSAAASGPNPAYFTYWQGFLAYRLDGRTLSNSIVQAFRLRTGANRLAGIELEAWTPVSSGRPIHSAKNGNKAQGGVWATQSVAWVEAVGYAVMAAALGTGALSGQSCSSATRIVHQPSTGKANGVGTNRRGRALYFFRSRHSVAPGRTTMAGKYIALPKGVSERHFRCRHQAFRDVLGGTPLCCNERGTACALY